MCQTKRYKVDVSHEMIMSNFDEELRDFISLEKYYKFLMKETWVMNLKEEGSATKYLRELWGNKPMWCSSEKEVNFSKKVLVPREDYELMKGVFISYIYSKGNDIIAFKLILPS